ncbi:MAG: enoyl-CoA hydratase/isomerase family protein [Corynebacterium sp.]|nr:enoyl-CoA hydratase/isomerase family protein [Corynebacterium sp.]
MSNRPTENLVNAFVRNSTGMLELNRPRALNSLNPEMVDNITVALDRWIDDESVHRVIIYSASDRAFCAGGDVRIVREEALEGSHDSGDQFFNAEYEMNNDIANFPKPYVAVIDGVAMGGGLGVSLHGSHRVVTEKAYASMPEMVIGFIPDVGVSWMMQRMVGELGRPSPALATFLGVTGWRLSPADMIWSGMATDFVPSKDVQDFIDMVVAESLDEALERYTTQVEGESELAGYIEEIEECFDFETWAEIQDALNRCENKAFVASVEQLIKDANPTSLVAAAELFAANRYADTIRKGLDNEFTIGSVLRRDPNFAEGVRAVLVDKDRNAKFNPATVDEVDAQYYRQLLGR